MLQKLFFYLQMSKGGACTTTDLTKSFGWNDAQAFEQQDVARRPIAAHTRARASPFPGGFLPPRRGRAGASAQARAAGSRAHAGRILQAEMQTKLFDAMEIKFKGTPVRTRRRKARPPSCGPRAHHTGLRAGRSRV